jgi:heavy metal translocating P-type ATPase
LSSTSSRITPVPWDRLAIAGFAIIGILLHLVLRFGLAANTMLLGHPWHEWPLLAVLVIGGVPLIIGLAIDVARGEFGADLLAGLAMVTAVLMDEFLAGALVVLMLSGGEALEAFAVRHASGVLDALARRMPLTARRKTEEGSVEVRLDEVKPGDLLLVPPHEICPVDGVVAQGRGSMDESFLTGEPYRIEKTPGSEVISGAINGPQALVIEATRPARDSRYARIMEVMQTAEDRRPRLRRLADRLGAWYTPTALLFALAAWGISGESNRFLAVLVVATPCPLLIAVPVAIIGSISLAARRGIIIRDPAVLERISECRTAIFDKTGTLTRGEPELADLVPAEGFERPQLLRLVAALERYSKHPLAGAVLEAAERERIEVPEADEIHEKPGAGMTGLVAGVEIGITSRRKLLAADPAATPKIPAEEVGLECVVTIGGRYAGLLRFRDEPRKEGRSFVGHLAPTHDFARVMIVSGDREAEVRHLARAVGITEVHAGKTPEEKLEIVRRETAAAPTVYLGDGINDAPALTTATVGIAFGQLSDITGEAAGAVILERSLTRVDELLHIGLRMRRIALESALGGMVLSGLGMIAAGFGVLPPVSGAIAQEVIDVLAVANALRAAAAPRTLSDHE